MVKLALLLILAITTMALAYPAVYLEDGEVYQMVPLRIIRSADPGHHRYGGHHGGYPNRGGGNSFAQSSANAGSYSSSFGSESFANANSKAGSQGWGR